MLNRYLSFLLVMVLLFGLVSCAGSSTGKEAENYDPEDLMQRISEKIDVGYDLVREGFRVSEEEVGFYYSGIKESVNLVEDNAVMMTPSLGQEFSVVLVKLKKPEDAEIVKKEMRDGNNLNRWVCRTAEQLLVTSNGNMVICIMGTKEECEQVASAFDSFFQNKSSERLTKSGN